MVDECFFVTYDVFMVDWSENSHLIYGIFLFFIGQILQYNHFQSIKLPIGQTFYFINFAIGTITKFVDQYELLKVSSFFFLWFFLPTSFLYLIFRIVSLYCFICTSESFYYFQRWFLTFYTVLFVSILFILIRINIIILYTSSFILYVL